MMRLKRIIAYFKHLVNSFEIMQDGMERQQFLKFRMSLLPASGFQSVQYRKIEILSTDPINLAHPDQREKLDPYTPEDYIYDYLYWKSGATELATGKKTLTLNQFDDRYSEDIIDLIKEYRQKNLWRCFQKHFETDEPNEDLTNLLREFDLLANVYWPLAHYKSAVRYLNKDEDVISATGGTNWQKYLPPRYQRVQFFPSLWSAKELEEWGKGWVMKEVFNKPD
ncbi:MAG: tryptophan 2,3-dioxygenase family protein [Bacteroidota bacterium]